MADLEEQKQIFFTNLLLLDFDPAAMERKWRIPFNKDMFNLPNKKGFETVIYLIFEKLDPLKCREEFRDCWPVLDKKSEQVFRRVCLKWLSQIAEEEEDCFFPRVGAPLFMSPFGERFYELFFYFTTYVLKQIAHTQHGLKRQDFLRRPCLNAQTRDCSMPEIMESATQCSAVRLRNKFLQHAQQTGSVQDEWKKFTLEQVKRNRVLNKDIKQKERQLQNASRKQLDSSMSPSSARRHANTTGYDYDIESVKRSQKVQQVREQWRQLEEFLDSNEKAQEVVDSVLSGSGDLHKLDATDLGVRIPDLLLRRCEQEISRRGINNVYQGGKLDLVSLLHLWNMSLHLYLEKLHQGGVPNFSGEHSDLANRVHVHQTHLNNIQALRTKLQFEVLPELKVTIPYLKEQLNSRLLGDYSPDSIRTTSLGLGLLPPSPTVSFEPDDAKTPQGHGGHIAETLKMPTDHVSTPEAAAELIHDVSHTVRSNRQQQILNQGSPVYAPARAILRPDNTQTQKPPVRSSQQGVKMEKVGQRQRTHLSYTGNIHQAQHQGVSVKSTTSGTSLEKVSQVSQRNAKKSLTAQTTKPGPPSQVRRAAHSSIQTDHQGFKVPTTTVQPGRTLQLSSSNSGPQPASHRKPKSSTPPSLKPLMDKIVDSVLGASPTEQEEEPPTRIDDNPLNDSVFISHDKLLRTPVVLKSERKTLTSQDSVGSPASSPEDPGASEDNLDSMGPLSSTRIDHNHSKGVRNLDSVAAKLFTSDIDDEIITLRPNTDNPLDTLPGTHQLIPDPLVRLRAVMSPLGDHPPSSISSISPRSDRSLKVDDSHRYSSLLDDPKPERHITFLEDERIGDGDFLGDRTLIGDDDDEMGDYTSPAVGSFSHKVGVSLLGFDSPLGSPALRDSLMEDSIPDLLPADDLYQTLLETKTPCLPQRSRTHFNNNVAAASPQHKHPADPAISRTEFHADFNASDIEESVHVIEFQNGSFRETLDCSPIKLSDHLSTPSSSKKSSRKSSPRKMVTEHLESVRQSLDLETNNLISRYKQILNNTGHDLSGTDQDQVEEQDISIPTRPVTENQVIHGGARPKPMPLINETPTMSFLDSYLKTSPAAGKYGAAIEQSGELSQSIVVNKFQLDMDSDEETDQSDTWDSRQNPVGLASHQQPIDSSRNFFKTQDRNGVLIPGLNSPQKLTDVHIPSPMKHGEICLSTIPLSPYTKQVHQMSLSSPGRGRVSPLEGLFTEDASCLIPSTPP